jgi:hypothetical protein
MSDQKHRKSSPAIQVDTWGTKGNLTEAQQTAFNSFTQRARADYLGIAKFKVETIESVSLRFLRARNFNVDLAITLLGECVKRKTDGQANVYANLSPDECGHCDIEALKKWYPHAQFGYDIFNRPILFEHSGNKTKINK